jgi:hypothetical protein
MLGMKQTTNQERPMRGIYRPISSRWIVQLISNEIIWWFAVHDFYQKHPLFEAVLKGQGLLF